MRSPSGFGAAVVFLLALPAALLFGRVAGGDEEVVIHAAFAFGSALMAVAVFDFKTARWMTAVGCLALGALAAIFLLQFLSALTPSATLHHIAYEILGQGVEGWLVDLFLLWCIGVLFFDRRGATSMLGLVAMAIVVCVEVYSRRLMFLGTSLDAEAPGLKLLFLLPFVWLLFESRSRARPPR